MSKPATIVMNAGEKCHLTFELSLIKRIFAWITNDRNPAEPLSITIAMQSNDKESTTTIVVDNKHFKKFKIENVT